MEVVPVYISCRNQLAVSGKTVILILYAWLAMRCDDEAVCSYLSHILSAQAMRRIMTFFFSHNNYVFLLVNKVLSVNMYVVKGRDLVMLRFVPLTVAAILSNKSYRKETL